jgi:FdhD protein
MTKIDKTPVPLILPNPGDPRLTERVTGTDQTGAAVEINVPVERPLTLYLNAQEIVTMMTIGDYPEYLALGYLLNQNMLKYDDVVTGVEYYDDLQVVVVRTEHHTNFEQKLKKRTQTSGCAQGTAFGDLLEAVENVALPRAELRTSWLYQMTHAINTMPSLYLEAGAIHGCVLCKEGTPVCYTEDVGRHNAVDKIAGWIYRHGVDPADKILYTTGRLTSEMIIKTVRMGIPILVSRSGFTAWGVDLARQVGLTLVGRARGRSKTSRRGTNARAPNVTSEFPPTPGVLLAGGLARRMGGGDKPMRRIGGRTILERVIARLKPQCDGLILNANGDPARFASFGLPVIPDSVADFPGPLAGILAGLDWAATNRPEVSFVLSAAADCPVLPRDLVARLHQARAEQNAQLAVAASGGQSHPVIGLWSVALREELRHALVVEDVRKIDRWTARYKLATVTWPVEPLDPFFNANTVDDIAEAERLAALDGG